MKYLILFLLFPILVFSQATVVLDGTPYSVSGAVNSTSAAGGQKAITTLSANKTLALSDFDLTGNDVNKLSWFLVDTDITISVPVITGTTRSIIFQALPGVTITFEATSTQLFSIPSEDATVNSFTVTDSGRVAITPLNATNYSIDGINVIGFDIDNTNPGTVSSFSATNIQNTSVDFTWFHATDNVAVSYYEFSTDGTNYSNIGYTTSYTAQGLTSNTSYTFYIRAVDTSGNIGPVETVGATTTAGLTLLTDGNANPNVFAIGSGSFVADDTVLYNVAAGNSWTEIQLLNQTAVAESVNGSTYVNEIIGNGSNFSRIRPRIDGMLVDGTTYEFDFIYKMVGGGTYGRLSMMGFSVNNLSATEYTVISGTFTADATRFSADIYASSDNAANSGEGMRWKLIIKEQ